ncbi:MAG: hypothetical protein ACK4KV_02790 [Rhodocyclaceae bacterium]
MRINLWTGVVCVVFAVTLLAWVVPEHGGGGFAYGLPPQLVATIGAWVMLVFALGLTLQSLIGLLRLRAPLVVVPGLGALWHHIWPFAYVLAFIVAAAYLPLTWIAPLLIGCLLFMLGERRWPVLVLATLGPTAGLYVLTVYLMKIGVV